MLTPGTSRHPDVNGQSGCASQSPPSAARRVAQWLVFSDTWNAILDELRAVDLISERERRNLVFMHLPIDDTVEVGC